jgi:phage-related protein
MMSQVEVVFYQADDGSVPALDALVEFARTEPKVADKFQALIEALVDRGFNLRRPMADQLRDKIYELRCKVKGINHRMLYFYGGEKIAVLSHHLIKEAKIPPKEINLAIKRRKKFLHDPQKHTFVDEE